MNKVIKDSECEYLMRWSKTLSDIWGDDLEGRDTSKIYGYSNMEETIYYTEGKIRAICNKSGLSPEDWLENIYY